MDRRTVLIASGALAALPSTALRAQAFPSRPITLYCAFPAGGPTDQVLRAFAESASRTLGQPIVVESKPGAGRNCRTDRREEREARRIHIDPTGDQRVSHSAHAEDAAARCAARLHLHHQHDRLHVRSGGARWRAVEDVKDFVEDAKKNPGKIDYGSTGSGTTPHLAIEEFAAKAGIKLTHVPFKGSADLMTSILGGHIQAASDSTGWAPHVESGKLRLLATYGSKRTKKWPDVPTLAELGYDTVSDSPFGIGGPPGMDPAVVKTLHDAFRKTLEDPKVLAILDRFDQSVIYMSPEEYTKYARQMVDAERVTIDRLGLRGTM